MRQSLANTDGVNHAQIKATWAIRDLRMPRVTRELEKGARAKVN